MITSGKHEDVNCEYVPPIVAVIILLAKYLKDLKGILLF